MQTDTSGTSQVKDAVRKSKFLCLPAEIVGIRKTCGESDFSIHVLDCHDVFGTFVLDFAHPTNRDKQKSVISIVIIKRRGLN